MKVKAKSEADKEKQFAHDLAYEEFIRANNPESSCYDLENTDNVFCKARVIKHSNHLYPLNNPHYHPLQRA